MTDDIGVEASVKIEAWPLENGLKQKLLVHAQGYRLRRQNDQWRTPLYRPRPGRSLVVVSRDTVTQRYIGLEVPPDDTVDARLKAPSVVAVLTYASADSVIAEALITCVDAGRGKLLRSFAREDQAEALPAADASGERLPSTLPRLLGRTVQGVRQRFFPGQVRHLGVESELMGSPRPGDRSGHPRREVWARAHTPHRWLLLTSLIRVGGFTNKTSWPDPLPLGEAA